MIKGQLTQENIKQAIEKDVHKWIMERFNWYTATATLDVFKDKGILDSIRCEVVLIDNKMSIDTEQLYKSICRVGSIAMQDRIISRSIFTQLTEEDAPPRKENLLVSKMCIVDYIHEYIHRHVYTYVDTLGAGNARVEREFFQVIETLNLKLIIYDNIITTTSNDSTWNSSKLENVVYKIVKYYVTCDEVMQKLQERLNQKGINYSNMNNPQRGNNIGNVSYGQTPQCPGNAYNPNNNYVTADAFVHVRTINEKNVEVADGLKKIKARLKLLNKDMVVNILEEDSGMVVRFNDRTYVGIVYNMELIRFKTIVDGMTKHYIHQNNTPRILNNDSVMDILDVIA